VLAVGQFLQRFRAGAELFVRIAQVAHLADDADLDVIGAPCLADTGIEHRRFEARIGADDQDGVGFLDTLDGRIEDVGGAAQCAGSSAAPS
jgi:hypothetical protein